MRLESQSRGRGEASARARSGGTSSRGAHRAHHGFRRRQSLASCLRVGAGETSFAQLAGSVKSAAARPAVLRKTALGLHALAMTVRPLFATPLYEASLAGERGFEALNAELEDACRMLAQEDRAGRAWCREQHLRRLHLLRLARRPAAAGHRLRRPEAPPGPARQGLRRRSWRSTLVRAAGSSSTASGRTC